MENGTVQKGQNLLEDFVWPIDTGRLMGDPVLRLKTSRKSAPFFGGGDVAIPIRPITGQCSLFSGILYPHPQQFSLRSTCLCRRGYGLTVIRKGNNGGWVSIIFRWLYHLRLWERCHVFRCTPYGHCYCANFRLTLK